MGNASFFNFYSDQRKVDIFIYKCAESAGAEICREKKKKKEKTFIQVMCTLFKSLLKYVQTYSKKKVPTEL